MVAKLSLAGKCVPKCNLGTRKEVMHKQELGVKVRFPSQGLGTKIKEVL